MNTSSPAIVTAAPILTTMRDTRLQRAASDLWRVIDASGRILGHLQTVAHPLGVRYRARRFHPATARLRDLGEFWAVDDAIGALRAS